MHADRPSATAFYVALHRAAHQLRDTPRILDDPLALRILGAEAEAAVRTGTWRHNGVLTRRFRSFLAVRSRFAEDELAAALDRGVRQYVVLGAGLDTSAYRLPPGRDGVRIFEVDHPATQAWKRRQLAAAGIAVPAALTFVPTEFERQPLTDALAAAGWSPTEPAFVSWLGVVPYLTPEAVWRTLRLFAARPRGTTVVFDYVADPATLSWFSRLLCWSMARSLRRAGEPWRSHFRPEALGGQLRAAGFGIVADMGPETLSRRYGDGRLRLGQIGHVMRATV